MVLDLRLIKDWVVVMTTFLFFIDFPFLLLAAQLPDISNARLVPKLRPGVDTKARRVKKAGKCRSGDKHHSVVINKKDLALPRRPRGQREQHEASRNTAGEGEFEARNIRDDRLWLRQVGDREVLPGEVEKRAHDSGNIPARPGIPPAFLMIFRIRHAAASDFLAYFCPIFHRKAKPPPREKD